MFHTKKRNKLSTAQLERLVYCHCNLRLLEQRGNRIAPQQVNPDLIDIEKVKDIPQIPAEERDIYTLLYEEAMQPIRATRSRSRAMAARLPSVRGQIVETTQACTTTSARATRTSGGAGTSSCQVEPHSIDSLDDSSDSEWTSASEGDDDEVMEDTVLVDSAEEV